MIKSECPRCAGSGFFDCYRNIVGGECFRCHGKGYVMVKKEPVRSKTYIFSFLWNDPSDANYKDGEFCRCFRKKFRNAKAAAKHAAEVMAKNGSVDFIVSEER